MNLQPSIASASVHSLEPVFYSVTVDTEEEWDWNGNYPTADLSVRNIDHLPEFQAICHRNGAAVTYFVDHAILANARSREVILDLAKLPRVEIGMHIHPWNTPPLVGNGRVAVRDTFLQNLPPDLIRAKLSSVHELFVKHGLRPTSFRGGRYSTSSVVQDFLRENEFVADSSVLPFSTWPDDGAPDYRSRRLEPIRRSASQDGPALWELPLTLAFSRRPFGLWHRLFEFVERTPLRHLRLIGIAERLGLVRKAWLNIETPLGRRPRPFLRLLRQVRPPSIDICLHSSSLIPGGNVFTQTPADREHMLANLNDALSCLAEWKDFRPATVTEIAHHLEDRHARLGNQPAR
jgi:hypothetical protein